MKIQKELLLNLVPVVGKLKRVATDIYGSGMLVLNKDGSNYRLDTRRYDVTENGKQTEIVLIPRKDNKFYAFYYAGSVTKPVMIGLVDGVTESANIQMAR